MMKEEEERNMNPESNESDAKNSKLDEKKFDDDRSNIPILDRPKQESGSKESTDNMNKIDDIDVQQPNNTTNETNEAENSDDASFEAFCNTRSAVKKRKKKQIMKIKISGLPVVVTKSMNTKSNNTAWTTQTPKPMRLPSVSADSFMPISQKETEKELEDSLKFFQESHEDQDPSYKIIQKKKRKDFVHEAVKRINDEDVAEKNQIELIVKQQLKEKQDNTERTIEKYRMKIEEEYKRDMVKIQKAYQDKSRSNQAKIDQGIKLLQNRHSTENQKLHHQHRHQSQQRQLPEQAITAEWQQISHRLRQKHQRQIAEFSTKGNDVVNKCKNDSERQRLSIENQYEKRKQDLHTNRTNLYGRIYVGFQQLRQRYLKRHTQSIAKRIAALKDEYNDPDKEETIEKKSKKKQSARDKAKSDMEERIELRPVSPIKTAADWHKHSTHDPSGGATRHKHRKGVLTQINRQLSVEIHNEGIWLTELSEKKADHDKKKSSSSTDTTMSSDKHEKHFFPWGATARKVLESIVCGEIPHACDSLKLNFTDTVAQNGGHVRCLMTDLRTSDATASAQRTKAIIEKESRELREIEEKDLLIRTNVMDTEKEISIIKKSQNDLGLKLKENLKDLEKTKESLQTFRTKYSRYFGADGKPLPANNPSDSSKLSQATMKYKIAIENSERRSLAIKSKLSELQASRDKRVVANQQGQTSSSILKVTIKNKKAAINEVRMGRMSLVQIKSLENTTKRVEETIDVLSLTAVMRRDQLNQKRNSSTCNWVQSLPGLNGPLRRSLWYKMHRRRQQIVLRPTFNSMLTNMRDEVECKSKARYNGTRPFSKEMIDAELVKAEQSYLLATHPIVSNDETLPSVPTASVWAEPGWHLLLDVDTGTTQSDRLLPCPPRQPLVQYNLSELHSAPGRQAASMINSTHLRSLETSLSAVATATSLAETDSAMASIPRDAALSLNDPLKISSEALKIGYRYNSSTKQHSGRPTIQRRKSSTAKDTTIPSTNSKVSRKRQSVTSPPNPGVSRARPDSTRKRKNVSQPEPSSAPRSAQRKKTSESSTLLSVDDKEFQPRPIMTQPQHPISSPPPFNRHQQSVSQQQSSSYRGTFSHFQNTPQLNQFGMMQQPQQPQLQQHHQPHSTQQKIKYVQNPPQQAMRSIPQFFSQMNQQQFSQQQDMQVVGPQRINVQGSNSLQKNNIHSTDDAQNDPLFMLKEM